MTEEEREAKIAALEARYSALVQRCGYSAFISGSGIRCGLMTPGEYIMLDGDFQFDQIKELFELWREARELGGVVD